MHGLSIHAIVFLAVNGLITAVWLLLGGSTAEVEAIWRDPGPAAANDFWPVWVMLPWATALVIHAGVVLSSALFGRRGVLRRRARRDRRRRRWASQRNRGEELAKAAVDSALESAATMVGRIKQSEKEEEEETGTADPTPHLLRVGVVFTDIVGSTEHTERMGDEAWREVLADHRREVREAASEHDGELVGTQGDGCLVRFPSAPAAVHGAIEVQRRLDRRRSDDDDYVPEIRVGIHCGEAVTDHEGDLIGRVVNLAARVTTAAEPGEILVTEPVADQLDSDVKVDDRGLVELRGVAQPRHLLAVLWEV